MLDVPLDLKAAEGARIAGASRIIGVDLNPSRFEEGTIKLDITTSLTF